MKKQIILTALSAGAALGLNSASAAELKVNDPAPHFTAKAQDGSTFDLNTRKGKWTVLFFYPKAGTPGCTKQACAFRDSVEKIHAQGAEVYGISTDTVEQQADFHTKHRLTYTLLADPNSDIVKLYGTKMPFLNMSKRWTFVLDPSLKIRLLLKNVDPVIDSEKVANQIAQLKGNT